MLSPQLAPEMAPQEPTGFEKVISYMSISINPLWAFGLLWVFWFLSLTWGILGIIAVIVSIFCMVRRKSNNIIINIGGILIAFLLGPLYFIYWGFMPGYCMK